MEEEIIENDKWYEIRMIWQTGIGSLPKVAEKYGLQLPEIMLKAREDGWGSRSAETSLDIKVEDLDYDKVSEEYRLSILKMKKLSDTIVDSLSSEVNNELKIESLDKLSKVVSRLMPLSRRAAAFKDVPEDPKEMARIILQKQFEAVKKGDVKMLQILGQQYLNQKEEMSLYSKHIVSEMDPKEAAKLYHEMLQGDNE